MKDPIAVIGIGCRFPGANSPQAFWQLLCDGVDAITEVPDSRWNADAFYDADPTQPHKMTTRWGGFLEQVDQFDPQFFSIAPREADTMDPQQRLLLEVAWEALEDAGQLPERLAGTPASVVVGISSHDYSSLVISDDPYGLTGNTNCVAANRISYVFNLKGPSLAVDTACSSSLVAVHLACETLWSGQSQLALAGGVQVLLAPHLMVSFSKAGLMAPDGRCKTFDARANGYVRSEGAGMVVLKPLAQAQADGDPIYGVIRGSAVNQDGRSNGLSAPNPDAQEAVLREAYRQAGVSPGQVQYVEAHGTGTKIGDPLEMKALGAVLAENRPVGDDCAVGSVKTNIGHSETAAGIAGLIKVALALKHQQIPPSLHFESPNPYIDFERLPLRVQQTLTPWPLGEGPALAGVSSFGFGGTNAHVVMEAWEQTQRVGSRRQAANGQPSPFTLAHSAVQTQPRPLHVLTVSAKTEAALQTLCQRYQDFLAEHPLLGLVDVCFSANTRRSHFNHRLSLITRSTQDLRQQLRAFGTDSERDTLISGHIQGQTPPQIAFLFTGQGAQYVEMGRQLYDTQPSFRATLDYCNEVLRPDLDQPLLEVLYPDLAARPQHHGEVAKTGNDLPLGRSQTLLHPLDQTAYTQPALFALEYALAQLWISWGITPDVVMGHSIGEYVAACIAGVFSLEDGLKLTAARGRLMQALPQDGAMVAVAADEAQVSAAIEPYRATVAIAAINGPQSLVISGERTAIAQVTTQLASAGIKTKALTVSHAFHSPLMEPMVAEFAQVAAQVTYARPNISLMSNITGNLITHEIATPEYWCLHVRQPVRFAISMATLQHQGYRIFIEIGPKPILLGMARTLFATADYPSDRQTAPPVLFLPSLRPPQSDWHPLLHSLGELYVHGATIDWAGFDQDYPRRVTSLPTYPFQRQRHWWQAPPKDQSVPTFRNTGAWHPLLGERVPLAATEDHRFQVQLRANSPPYLSHHRVLEHPVLPATAYVEMALAAGKEVYPTASVQLQDLQIEQPLLWSDSETKTLQLLLTPAQPSGYTVQIFSLTVADEAVHPVWTRHALAQLQVQAPSSPPSVDLASWPGDAARAIPIETFYQTLTEQGLTYGQQFQGIQQLWQTDRGAIGQIQLPRPLNGDR